MYNTLRALINTLSVNNGSEYYFNPSLITSEYHQGYMDDDEELLFLLTVSALNSLITGLVSCILVNAESSERDGNRVLNRWSFFNITFTLIDLE